MFVKVDNQVNFVLVEQEVLKFREETDAFNRLRDINKGNEPWSFLATMATRPDGAHPAGRYRSPRSVV
ncbi:MAG: hypothetical protein AB7K09_01300 [Planctomycetota bacterium]